MICITRLAREIVDDPITNFGRLAVLAGSLALGSCRRRPADGLTLSIKGKVSSRTSWSVPAGQEDHPHGQEPQPDALGIREQRSQPREGRDRRQRHHRFHRTAAARELRVLRRFQRRHAARPHRREIGGSSMFGEATLPPRRSRRRWRGRLPARSSLLGTGGAFSAGARRHQSPLSDHRLSRIRVRI